MGASNALDRSTSRFAWLRVLILSLVILFGGYSVILMYINGEVAFALMTTFVLSLGIYIFTNPKTYAHRYIFPGVAGMVIFILFPMAYTVGISYTNYSNRNLLSLERVQEYHLKQTFKAQEGSYDLALYPVEGSRYQLALTRPGISGEPDQLFVTGAVELWSSERIKEQKAEPKDFPGVEAPFRATQVESYPTTLAAERRVIFDFREHLRVIRVELPDGKLIVADQSAGIGTYSAVRPQFSRLDDGVVLKGGAIISDPNTLRDNRTQQYMRPNFTTGYYQHINEDGDFVGRPIAPGFTVAVGWDNYWKVLSDPGIQQPFFQIFVWTVMFAAGSVFFTLAIGMVLANLVQWEFLRGRAAYRVLLILPYAVPAFISILVFKGLFNQNFGEINLVLESLFGIRPDWYTEPALARTMILIVNTWLGYPYMMILCMGLLKSIPEDLYEASAMDGAGPVHNFFHITLPLLLRPLTPLLIASFAFNFNNFVLIQLLTAGRPDIIGATTPAGTTDILVSYTFRIAFEGGGGQDYGLAAAIATVIFIIVGALAVLNLKLSKMDKV